MKDNKKKVDKKVIEEKKNKRRLIIAFLVMIFVGLLFTATTYAWFTADKVVTIDMVDVHASTASGLTISQDAIDWKASLTNEDLQTRLTALL